MGVDGVDSCVLFYGYPHAIIQIFRWRNGRLSIPDTSNNLYYTRSMVDAAKVLIDCRDAVL
jgi:hypothetical protein